MAKFESTKSDLVVAFDGGFINFKNGIYVTTNKKEIDALKKCKGITVGGKAIPKPAEQEATL